jgi:hypothetical protein
MINNIKKLFGFTLIFLVMASCRKEELNPVAVPEPGVYGQGKLLSGSFIEGNDAASIVNMQLKWIDVNRILTINKQEIFVNFSEAYIDKNGNPAVADHGTKSVKTMDAKGNNEASTFSISATELYNLFKDATFDYGAGKVPVFGASRPAGSRFKKTDKFSMTWAFTSTDGKVYKWWSVSVVNGEVYADPANKAIAANANVDWGVK